MAILVTGGSGNMAWNIGRIGFATVPIPIATPRYYERLSAYFPRQEMKPFSQFEDLLRHSGIYDKLDDDQCLILYADFPDFLFVDYFLVQSEVRGRGIGTARVRQLQARGKPVILEIEPERPDDRDSALRRRFYLRHGFRRADQLVYRRKDAHGRPFDMDVFVWTPGARQPVDSRVALHLMARVCERVHNFHALQHCGRIPADPAQVLWLACD